MTWLASHPVLIALASHATVFWELSYWALVWNRFTRPLVLWMAVFVHLGIALFMGMITFGLAMIIANLVVPFPANRAGLVRPHRGPLRANVGCGQVVPLSALPA